MKKNVSTPSLYTGWRSLLSTTIAILFLSQTLPQLACLAAENTAAEQFSSVEERRLFNAIQAERASIRAEKNDLELRKKELKSIEDGVDKKLTEIDAKLEELKKLRSEIEVLLSAKSEEEVKRTQELAKIYEKMSPDKAALALSGLDPKLAADLLGNMKVKSAAKILDQISRQKATELSTTYSTIPIE